MFKKKSILIIVILCSLYFIPLINCSGESWLSGWNYRKIHKINSADVDINYQVSIKTLYNTSIYDSDSWILNDNNPIIEPSQAFEGNNIYSPTLIYEDSVFKMWYGGYDGTNDRIGFANSTDGVSWSKYSSNPVLDDGAGWDSLHVNDPSVVKVGLVYYMFYTGCAVSGHDEIGLANSTDGLSWIKDDNNPVIPMNATYYFARPSVIYEDSVFKMWFDRRRVSDNIIDGILYSESSDGITWSDFIVVLDSVSSQPANPEVRKTTEGNYIMAVDNNNPFIPRYVDIYNGANETSFSLDGDDILTVGSWNIYGSLTVGLIYVNSSWFMYFGGATNSGLTAQKIGLAIFGDVDNTVNLNGHCETDFSDVRITKSDGITLYDITNTTIVESSFAYWDILISDNLTDSDCLIYVYYGNSEAVNISNPSLVYNFWDDFNGSSINTSVWSTLGTVSVSNSIVDISTDTGLIRSTSTFTSGYSYFSKVKTDSYNSRNLGLAISGYDSVIFWFTYSVSSGYFRYSIQRTSGHSSSDATTLVYNNDYNKFQINWLSSSLVEFVCNDTIYKTITTSDYIPTIPLSIELSRFGAGHLYADYVGVKRYVETPPTHDYWGIEETFTPESTPTPTSTPYSDEDLSSANTIAIIAFIFAMFAIMLIMIKK